MEIELANLDIYNSKDFFNDITNNNIDNLKKQYYKNKSRFLELIDKNIYVYKMAYELNYIDISLWLFSFLNDYEKMKEFNEICIKGYSEILKKYGLDNLSYYEAKDAFLLACDYGKLEIVKLFLGNQLKNLPKYQEIINDDNQNLSLNQRGFFSACKNNHINLIKWLLSNDVNILHNSNINLYYDLFKYLSSYGNIDMIKLLIKYNEDFVMFFWNNDCYDLAVKYNHIELINYLEQYIIY